VDATTHANSLRGWKKLAINLALCAACVALNYLGSSIATAFGLPLYLDCIGTIVAGACGGYVPGLVVGYFTNLVTSLSDPSSVYWCFNSVLIGIVAAFFQRRGLLSKLYTVPLCILCFALIGGGLGSVITYALYGAFAGGVSTPLALQILEVTGMGDFTSQLCADMIIDLVDKSIATLVAIVIIQLVRNKIEELLDFSIWRQTPLEGQQRAEAKKTPTRGLSLRTKIASIIIVVMVIIAVVTTSISFMMFNRANIDTQSKMGAGIVELASEKINPNRIDKYLELGESMPGYSETERALAHIRDSFPDVKYIYVYQIKEDGCHVVFDPDTPEAAGNNPGDVIPFDPSFNPYIGDLLAGNPIEPVVSNDSYGYLLTIYEPLYDKNGNCTCYVAVDISMEQLAQDGYAFLIRVLILFAAFLIVICGIVLWLAEYSIIMPINSMAKASGSFAFDSKSGRDHGLEQLHNLDIRTGDEVENMYRAVTKMSEDTVQFIADSAEKAATIERMQDNLIIVMADLVESRDQHTGDHVRKTAAYTRVILEEMRHEDMYSDVITDEFIENVVKSAPLHDVGKITVSDSILNKPGRLTDEEFRIMQGHTIAGKQILEDATGAMSDAGYLAEAQLLATYHHEKWNGAGYPYGLAGEDIPLSARVMAVADVFDALVSKRSYKEGMPIEKALGIIRDDAGVHFDPQVAQAFLNAGDEVRRIAGEHGDDQGTASDIRDEAAAD